RPARRQRGRDGSRRHRDRPAWPHLHHGNSLVGASRRPARRPRRLPPRRPGKHRQHRPPRPRWSCDLRRAHRLRASRRAEHAARLRQLPLLGGGLPGRPRLRRDRLRPAVPHRRGTPRPPALQQFEHVGARRRNRHRAGRQPLPHPVRRPGCRHAARRRSHRRNRTDRFRGPGGPARGTRPHRGRLPHLHAPRPPRRTHPAAARRRRRTLPAAPRRTHGRRGHRVRRRPLPLPRCPPHAGAVMTRPSALNLRVGSAVALPVHLRSLLWALLLAAALLLTVVATLSLGKLGIPLTDVADVLTGNASPVHMFVLHRLSGPRVTVAIGVGAALGMAGALFQSVTRNPLGSPDVIGVNWGASAGAALVALAFPGTVPVPLGALLGAVAAVLTVATVTGTGLRHPGRLVVAGIGVAAMSAAFTQFVVAALARDQTSVLAAYVNGTLSARSWEHAATIW